MTYPPQQPGGWQNPWTPQPPAPPAQPGPGATGTPAGQPGAAAADAPPSEPEFGAQAGPAGVPPAETPPYPYQYGYGYGYPPGYPGYGYPVPAKPRTNGTAIAAMVVSIVGAVGLCVYGLGGYLGIVGAILGHASRREIRRRGEGGEGMALAGIVIGWISTGIAVLATIVLVVVFLWAANQDPSTFEGSAHG